MPGARGGALSLLVGLLAWGADFPAAGQGNPRERFSLPQPPPADRARVFVIFGGIPQDIYVNGIKIGGLDAKEAMIFDVHPAEYLFSWNSADPGVIVARTIDPLSVRLEGGTTLELSAQLQGDVARMQIVILIYDAKDRARRPIVRPTSCPPSICL